MAVIYKAKAHKKRTITKKASYSSINTTIGGFYYKI